MNLEFYQKLIILGFFLILNHKKVKTYPSYYIFNFLLNNFRLFVHFKTFVFFLLKIFIIFLLKWLEYRLFFTVVTELLFNVDLMIRQSENTLTWLFWSQKLWVVLVNRNIVINYNSTFINVCWYLSWDSWIIYWLSFI